MKIKHKLTGAAFILVFIITLAGIYSLITTDEIISVFRKGDVHFKDIIRTSTNISSCSKRAESHLILYLSFGDKADLERFHAAYGNLMNNLSELQKIVKKQNSRIIVEEIITSVDSLLPSAKDLVSSFSPEKSTGDMARDRTFRRQILEYHSLTSRIRKLGEKIAQLESDFLNKQEAISSSNEISSYIKRAEGNLMIYLFLGDRKEREKFFKMNASMIGEIRNLQHRMTSPTEKKLIRKLKESSSLFRKTGSTIIKKYESEKRKRNFSIAGYRKLIRDLNVHAESVREKAVKITNLKAAQEDDLKNMILEKARSFKHTLSVVIILSILIASVFGYVIIRSMSKPINLLKNAVNSFRVGKFDTRVNITSNDEFMILADAFNKMGDEISSRTISRDYLDNIIDSMSDSLIVLDPNGFIKTANSAALKMLKYESDELIGQNIAKILKGGYDFEMEILEKGLDFLKKSSDEIFIASDDREIPVSASFSVMYYQDGSIQGVVCVAKDIGERKKIEKELKEAKDKAEFAAKAKSQFLARMSHEIRTPMNAILGMSELVLDTELNPIQFDYLTTVSESSEHLLQILNDILDFSGIESGKLELKPVNFDLHGNITSIMKLFQSQAFKKGLYIRYNIDDDIPRYVFADKIRLNQILVNLLSNSLKFTEKGGVVVEVKKDTEKEVINKKLVPLAMSVIDTGIGIPEHKIVNIFRSFEQGDISFTRRFGGVGLGLAISKQIVEQMGGSIYVESSPDDGSEFRIRLSLQVGEEPPTVSVREYNSDVITDPGRKLNILVVEDNELNTKVARKLIEKLGHNVFEAVNGIDALKFFGESSCDIVLMDVEMEGMDGIEATQRIRNGDAGEDVKDIPILAMSAHVTSDIQEICFSAGMNGFITKPIRKQDLFAQLYKIFSIA
jgi:PAS domain S-box-containing protein